MCYGREFISNDLDLWDWSKGVTLDFSRPGKPRDNAFVESFNGKVRAECIDQDWFLSLDDTRSKCVAFPREYNEERPHSAIGNKTPLEFIKTIEQSQLPHGLTTEIFASGRSNVRVKVKAKIEVPRLSEVCRV